MNKSILTLHNKYFLFFSLMGLFFGLAVNQTINTVALYSVFIVLFYIFFLSLYRYSVNFKNIQFILILMIISFVIKIISVFLFENLMLNAIGIPFLSYKDDYVYDVTSSNILRIWENRGIGFYNDTKFSSGFYSGYPNISALAKFIFGDSYLVPRFLNVFFSTLTIPFFFLTVIKLTDNKKLTKIIVMIFSFSPVFVVYSGLQLKDTILIFFVSTLLYGTIDFFYKGISIKNILIVALSMGALLFFRAAILLPYIVALIFSSLVTKESRSNTSFNGLKSFLWVSLVVLFFYFVWEYLYISGILSLTGEEYFESRISSRGQTDSYQGSNNLSKFGIVTVFLGPLLALLSVILPAPNYIQLDEFSNTINYHYLPLLGYYAILPMVFVSLLYLIKNYRINKMGFFIVTFLILYKLGQAGDKSILDSRQSLPAIYAAYLLLAYFDLKNRDVSMIWKRYRIVILLILLIVMFSVTFFRYSARF